MDARDLKLSRKMQKLIRKVEALVEKEMGESMAVTLIVFPWARAGEVDKQVEYQYASNVPRQHMYGALEAVITKWKADVPDTPPHERKL